jgi:hypothetical protein
MEITIAGISYLGLSKAVSLVVSNDGESDVNTRASYAALFVGSAISVGCTERQGVWNARAQRNGDFQRQGERQQRRYLQHIGSGEAVVIQLLCNAYVAMISAYPDELDTPANAHSLA